MWRPPASATTPRPVLIFWYGGGWVKGDRRAYAFAARAYAKAGFVVVMPDYRKVPAIRFPAMLQDGAEAVKWTRDHIADYGGDPNRIAFAGPFGGRLYRRDARARRALAARPRASIRTIVKAAVGLSGPYNFYPFTSKRAIDAMGNAADPAMTQPITFARADAPPMLLVTSTDDTEVKPHNAYRPDRAAQGARRAGDADRLSRADHEDVAMALSKPFRGKAPVLADSVAFLNRAMPARR